MCALAATALVVFGEEIRWLRLSAVLALWAALIAAFAVSRARRDTRTAELRQEESRRTYELELLREVSARREYEVKVAHEAREQADSAHREELAALREQLERLAGALSGLMDGEVLVERLTLSAESTRVRSLGEGGRALLAGLTGPTVVTAPALAVAPLGPQPQEVVEAAQPEPTPASEHPDRPGPQGPVSTPVGTEPVVVAESVAAKPQVVAEPQVADESPTAVAAVEPQSAPQARQSEPASVVTPSDSVPGDVVEVAEPDPIAQHVSATAQTAASELDSIDAGLIEQDGEFAPAVEEIHDAAMTQEVYLPSPRPADPVEDDTITLERIGGPVPTGRRTSRPGAVQPAVEPAGHESAELREVEPAADPEPVGHPGEHEEPMIRGTDPDAAISVADLLAAYGAAQPGRRHRRHAEE